MTPNAAERPPKWTAQMTLATPLGAMLLARTDRGLGGAWFEHQKHHPAPIDAPTDPHDALLARAAAQLAEYFAGRTDAFSLDLDLHGTPFQLRVWAALLEIPRGRTRSYGDIARALGCATAVRAVGGAVGRNPVSVVVPCHRVIGSAGALTGYAGGIGRKQRLLELEQARSASTELWSD